MLFYYKRDQTVIFFRFQFIELINYLFDLHMKYTFIPFIKAINQILVICMTLALVFNIKEEGLLS